MGELWDVYDVNRKRTGRIVERGSNTLKEGEYHIVVTAIIINSKNEILMSKRAPHKKHPLMWECCGGSILAGETSLNGVLREIKEELGIDFSKKDAIFFKELRRDKIPPDFKDLWVFRKDIDIKDVTFTDGENIDAKWVNIDEFIKMSENNEVTSTIDIGVDELNEIFKLKQKEA